MDEKAPYMPVFKLLMLITVFVHIKKVSHLPSQLGIFVFTFAVKSFYIYGAILHLALTVFTFTGPYYIFTFRGETTLLAFWMDKISKFNRPKKIRKDLSNVHKLTYVQCMNNHYATLEYQGMKTFGVTYNTNQTPSKHFTEKKCLSSRPPKMKNKS